MDRVDIIILSLISLIVLIIVLSMVLPKQRKLQLFTLNINIFFIKINLKIYYKK
ncbi:hypothetical protein CBB_0920 [Clostridium botulinum Bf]|uniref:Uncharacterized protein n=2 Tax=Clostridium botulinum TaxID=1491 RepID=A0A077K8B4_CLOBO|nr:hypothetical protein CBB_0920 [Clostridium botulinum Bf]BAO05197.1 uncharacterized protein CBO05P2_172 [Clostridium botulinum B str. Osaka05]BAP25805.1 hypothetical protein [Clostridium botulinum]BDB03762.1 hypothetical protein CBOS2020_38360 [Clostridium botulinum]